MPAALEITRQIDRITLAHQVGRRLGLGVHVGVHDVPARIGHAASPFRLARGSSSSGTRTRSEPSLPIADAIVARVSLMSVTSTASNGPETSSRLFTTGAPTKRS